MTAHALASAGPDAIIAFATEGLPERLRVQLTEGWSGDDPLAAAVALDPRLVQTRPTTVDVELAGTLTRGMTVTDWSGRWARKPNALIAVEADPTLFFDRFIERVGPFARRLG